MLGAPGGPGTDSAAIYSDDSQPPTTDISWGNFDLLNLDALEFDDGTANQNYTQNVIGDEITLTNSDAAKASNFVVKSALNDVNGASRIIAESFGGVRGSISAWDNGGVLINSNPFANGLHLTLSAAKKVSVFIDRIEIKDKLQAKDAFITANSTVDVTADDQVVSVASTSFITLTSDSATQTDRSFTLSTTSIDTGHRVTIVYTDTQNCEILDSGNMKVAGTWACSEDASIQFVFDGTDWIELSRAAP